MSHRERVLDGARVSAHFAQLFDSPESVAAAVSAFVSEGLELEETVLVVITPEHWKSVSKRLARMDVMPAADIARGQLIVRNATDTLAGFMRRGSADELLFERSIGSLMRRLRRRGSPVRVYGEMVDLLAFEGNLNGALRLEQLWNALAEREPFTLFCGYSAANFGDPRTAEALKNICFTHSHVRFHPGDMLASYLLRFSEDNSLATLASPAQQ